MEILIERLNKSLDDKRGSEEVLKLTSKHSEIPVKDIISNSRKYAVKVARLVAANLMMNELYIGKRETATSVNRDRSLMYHYQSVHDGEYIIWKEYRELYDKTHFELTKGGKFKQISKEQIRHTLIREKIRDCQPSYDELGNLRASYIITTKIGRKSFKIKSKKSEIFRKLDNISRAFHKFNHEVKYKELEI
jgi:hypothetical protein